MPLATQTAAVEVGSEIDSMASSPKPAGANLDIDRYRRAIEPTSIFELLPREIIMQMIRGYFYVIKKGVTLRWSEYDSARASWQVVNDGLDPIDYDHPEHRQFYNEVCWEFRHECGHEKCRECDRCTAQEYSDGHRTKVEPYPCWLGLDDLAYPLKIGGRVRAVLFAGQIVPDDEERLSKIEDTIHAHTKAPFDDKLIELLHEERWRQGAGDPQYAQTLVQRLNDFGGMMQKILDALYEAREEAARREFLQRCEERLASADPGDTAAWWGVCSKLLASFAHLVRLQEVFCYSRERSRYRRPVAGAADQPTIPTREVLSAITAGRFQQADEEPQTFQLAERLGVPPKETRFYLSHTPAEGSPLSTLLVLRGQLDPAYERLTAGFAHIVAQSADFFSVVEHLRLAQQQYQRSVAEVAHDFRTPLQLMVFDLQDVADLNEVKDTPELLDRVKRSLVRAMGAEEHVLRLLGTVAESKDRLDLVKLVANVMKDLQPVAERHPCRLEPAGEWLDAVVVRGVEYQLRRAISNLIENAIKYSSKDVCTYGWLKSYYVGVQITAWKNNLVRVTIQNYGIGIPQELITQILSGETRVRAKIIDGRHERSGMGLGLPIAIRVIEDHDGWIDVVSEPADQRQHGRGEEYHRFLTTVNVYLPVAQ